MLKGMLMVGQVYFAVIGVNCNIICLLRNDNNLLNNLFRLDFLKLKR